MASGCQDHKTFCAQLCSFLKDLRRASTLSKNGTGGLPTPNKPLSIRYGLSPGEICHRSRAARPARLSGSMRTAGPLSPGATPVLPVACVAPLETKRQERPHGGERRAPHDLARNTSVTAGHSALPVRSSVCGHPLGNTENDLRVARVMEKLSKARMNEPPGYSTDF